MLKFLRALYNQSPLPQEETLYSHILNDQHNDLISPQMYYLLNSRHLTRQVPDFFREELKKRTMRRLFLSAMIKKELEEVLEQFEKRKIEVIPLKGPRFAEKYFDSLAARGTSDIDILVKPYQIDQAIEMIHSLGYTSTVPYEQEHFHTVFSKMTRTGYPLNVEIHWHFLRKGTSALTMDSFWKDAIPLQNYRYVRELSDFHLFYIICLHGWNHELISWKYFIDIIQMIEKLKDQLDYGKLFTFSRNAKTYRRIAHTLEIVYHEFPHLNQMKPLPLDAHSTYWWDEQDLCDDHQLKATLRVLVKRVKQVKDYDTHRQKWIFLKRNLVPDPVIMARIIGDDKMKWPRLVQYLLFLGECLGEIVRSLFPSSKRTERYNK